jgi:hypothetical protein
MSQFEAVDISFSSMSGTSTLLTPKQIEEAEHAIIQIKLQHSVSNSKQITQENATRVSKKREVSLLSIYKSYTYICAFY